MNAALRTADRAEAARKAARSWRDSGLIDQGALASVETAYPDDRVTAGKGIRILLFVFTSIAVFAAVWLAYELVFTGSPYYHALGWASLLLMFGSMLVVLTEVQHGALKRWRGGTEEATAFLSVALLAQGVSGLISSWARDSAALAAHHEALKIAALALTALVCAAGAWRWGYWPLAACAGAYAFAAVARVPGGRWIWFAVALAAAPALVRLGASARVAPSHRRCATALLLVVLAALYAAVSIYSLDHHFVEWFGGTWSRWDAGGSVSQAPNAVRWLSMAGTALVPIVLVAAGIRWRRRALILPGLALGILSLVTLHHYVDLLPDWTALVLAGSVLIGSGLLLRRWLDAGQGRERGGFTAETLAECGASRRAVEIAAAAAMFTPSAAAQQEPAFKPGGGSAGGAGAGGEYR